MRSQNTVKNILSTFFLQLITIICGLILPRAILLHYGSNVNGLISSIAQFLAYISLLDAGIGSVVKAALYRPIAKNNKDQIERILKSSQRFLNGIVIVFLLYIVALCFFYPNLMQSEFSTPFTISLIVIISLSTIAEYAFGLANKLFLQAAQHSYVIALIQILTTVLTTVGSVILINLGASIQAVKLFAAGVFLLRPLIQQLYIRRRYQLNFRKNPGTYKLKQRWDSLVQHIAYVIHENTDVVVLTLFSSTAEISVYAVYRIITTGVRGLTQSLYAGIDSVFGDMQAKNELDNLNKKLHLYELLYYTIITIVFTCTFVLITPFVGIFTHGITDADYFRPLFGYIIVLSELILAIRQPYSAIAMSAGKFRETRRGAILEAGTNIIISVILVWHYGLIGVAIGTFVGTFIRVIDYILFSSRHLLHRSPLVAFKHVLVAFLQLGLCSAGITLVLQHFRLDSYFSWALAGLASFVVTTLFVIGTNLIIYHRDFRASLTFLKKALLKKK